MLVLTVAGVCGFGIYVASYGLLQVGRLDSRRRLYPALNLVAASLVMASLVVDFNLPSFLLQLIWIVMSAAGLVTIGVRSLSSVATRSPWAPRVAVEYRWEQVIEGHRLYVSSDGGRTWHWGGTAHRRP